jgi:leader peptidase (prepilin peptidase) / N-methyltransferase
VSTVIVESTFLVGSALAGSAAVIDARTHRLPNRLVGPLALVGTLGVLAASLAARSLGDSLARLALGALVCAGPWMAIHLISPSSIGFGDVKYSAALGFYLAWFDPMLGLTAGVFTAFLAWPHSIVNVLRRNSATVPLGPYLLAGAIAAIAIPVR